MCIYSADCWYCLSHYYSKKGDRKTRIETGTSFKGRFGLNVFCGKADRVNLLFRISTMAVRGP